MPPKKNRKDLAAGGEEPGGKWLVVQAPLDEADEVDPGGHYINGRDRVPGEEEPTYQWMPLPLGMQTALEPSQRVLQICVGADHGLLLIDVGVAFTWGDNRYGQLGRKPVLKEENGTPYPVLDLLDDEILQVASGRHHCLALTATGLVWAWGRNKRGQLGCGNNRDSVFPVKVTAEPIKPVGADSPCLGGGPDQEIICIAAGGNSSVAAAKNSDVWQWGLISARVRDGQYEVAKNRPYKAINREKFRSQLRRDKVSISATRCVVMDKESIKREDLIKYHTANIQKMQHEVGHLRDKLSQMEGEKRVEVEEQMTGDVDSVAKNNLADTIAWLERKKLTYERDIEVLQKNIEACDREKDQIKTQLHTLEDQRIKLTKSQDRAHEASLRAKPGSNERRKLEDEMQSIKEFVEASQNTRMAILDQRAETEKERQNLMHDKAHKEAQKDMNDRRLRMVKELSRPLSDTAPDSLMSMLRKLMKDISQPYQLPVGAMSAMTNAGMLGKKDRKDPHPDFFTIEKKKLEGKRKALEQVTEQMSLMAMNFPEPTQVQQCTAMLTELINLEWRYSDMQADKLLAEDLDLKDFFAGSKKPRSGRSVFSSGAS